MVSQVIEQNVLSLAQQGDPDAIAVLINKVVSKKGVTATAKSKGTCLHIVLESDRVPNQASCVRFVHDGMIRLNPKYIDSVRLYGRRSDQKWPTWTELVELRQSAYASTSTATLPRLVTPGPQPKRKTTKLKTKYRKKIPLLLLGSICWILVAAVGFVVRAKMDSQVAASQQPTSAQRQIAKQAVPKTTQKIGVVPLPPPKTSPKPQAVPKTTQKTGVAAPKKSPIPSPAANKPTPKTSPAPVQNLAPVSTSEPSENAATFITIKAVGDIVPGTNFPNNRLPSNNKELFKNVKPYLQGADILFGNFESTLTNYPRTSKDTSRAMVHAFRTPPNYATLLKETGFDVLSVANNHSLDFSVVGFADTMKNIKSAGMTPVGKKNEVAYVNVKNIRVAFIGFSHLALHNSVNDIASAKALVLEAKKNANMVVVSFHGGAEGTGAMHVKNRQENFYGENRGNLVLFSRTMIDNGADLVLGHGPHVPRAMELYKGKLIAYSLGNFVGYKSLSTWGVLGQSLILELKLNPQGDFVSGKIIPVQLNRQGIPYIDQQFRSVQLIRNLTKSDFPNNSLKIDSKGEINKD
ncbi:CapA family protein [Argonema antarcticum]|uniref:CapA family protein n=1 Tax=Argonema antarcticum TaxID=2942763 RepID=UPI00201381B1|nr:CapA family protein [Argonema antarcticum]MCL1471999.1 CapA family protein [Argonema antarcticum A004/B2]